MTNTPSAGDLLSIGAPTPTSERDSINCALGNRTVWAGSDNHDEPDADHHIPVAPPRPQLPGRRGFGGTVELSEGGSIATFTDHAKDVQRGVYVPSHPVATPKADASPPVFMAEGSTQRILAKDARMTDLVDLGGALGVTSLGSALHNGWLEERNGSYVKAGEAAPRPAPRPKAKTPQDLADDGEADLEGDTAPTSKTPEAPAQRSYLSHQDEAKLVQAERQIGAQQFSALETAFADTGGDLDSIPTGLVANVARSLGVDHNGALAAIREHATPVAHQAHQALGQYIGAAGTEDAFNWARQDPQGRQLLQKAIRDQLDHRSLASYRAVAAGYLSALAKSNPEAVAAGLRAGGSKATVKGGRVIVTLPDGTNGEFSSLVRGGVIWG